jgi:hypothetical protein
VADALIEIIAWLFDSGVPSPDTLRTQRLARLTANLAAAAFTFGIRLWAPEGSVWTFVVVAAGFTALWATAFSLADAAREYPPVPWVSVAAVLVGAVVAVASCRLVVERL